MDYNKIYEQYAPDYDVLRTEYIKDDEEGNNAYDRKSFINFLDYIGSENDDDDWKSDALTLEHEPSLRKWWSENYDPKGIAMTMSYHSSILEDVRDMIDEYSKSTKHYKRTKITDASIHTIHRSDETAVYFSIGEYNEDTGSYCKPEEVFLDNLLYYYSGAPIKDVEVDEEKKIVIMTWDNDILKTIHG